MLFKAPTQKDTRKSTRILFKAPTERHTKINTNILKKVSHRKTHENQHECSSTLPHRKTHENQHECSSKVSDFTNFRTLMASGFLQKSPQSAYHDVTYVCTNPVPTWVGIVCFGPCARGLLPPVFPWFYHTSLSSRRFAFFSGPLDVLLLYKAAKNEPRS